MVKDYHEIIYKSCESLTKNGTYDAKNIIISNINNIFKITIEIDNVEFGFVEECYFKSSINRLEYIGPFYSFNNLTFITEEEFYNKFILPEIRNKIIDKI